MEILKRPVSLGDAELIFRWRNSASARNASRIDGEVTKSEHANWFSSRLSRIPSEPFWIMSSFERDIGYVRLDRVEEIADTYLISIYIIPEFRAVGNGKKMLEVTLKSAISDVPVRNFLAVIKNSNKGSITLFRKFGFEFVRAIDTNFDQYQVSVDRINLDENSI